MGLYKNGGSLVRSPASPDTLMSGDADCCCGGGCPCGMEGVNFEGSIDGGGCPDYIGYTGAFVYNGAETISDTDADGNPITVTGVWTMTVGVSAGSSWVIKAWCNTSRNRFRAMLYCDGSPATTEPADVNVTSCDPGSFEADVDLPIDDGTDCACSGPGPTSTHVTFTL